MSDAFLGAVASLVQRDACNRGYCSDPVENLLTVTAGDFESACRSLVSVDAPTVAIVTGFTICQAVPPAPETDGPLGALFLARVLTAAGGRVSLAADENCVSALRLGVRYCGLAEQVPVITLPPPSVATAMNRQAYRDAFLQATQPLTHLIAIERAGPSHTVASVAAQPGATSGIADHFAAEVPESHRDRCLNFRGIDITPYTSPAHWLFERLPGEASTAGCTIAIGDGGNEIGMGKVPWSVIRRNILGGGAVACRIPADYLVVSGTSNWGAYGVGVAVALLRGISSLDELCDLASERRLLEILVHEGGLVDGVRLTRSISVDGLPFFEYALPLVELGKLISEWRRRL